MRESARCNFLSIRAALAAAGLALMVAGCTAIPAGGSVSAVDKVHSAAAEDGVVVRTQVILLGAAGGYVGRTESATDSVPWDASGAGAATNEILRIVSAQSDRPTHDVTVGTSYAVRLACGGVVYIFEPGQQRLELGQAVRVEHALTSRILQ